MSLYLLLLLSSVANAGTVSVSGTYLLPSQPGTSLPVPFSNLVISEGGLAQLEFQLPEDLVGPKTIQSPQSAVIQMNEVQPNPSDPIGARVLDGPMAHAACQATVSLWNCQISYSSSYIKGTDDSTVEHFLENKYADRPELLQTKLALYEAFSRDPEGILTLQIH